MIDERRLARNPIAIVGMSGLLPNAHDHRQYWRNIVDGVDCTSDVPDSRWRLDDYFDPDASTPDKTYSDRGAFLPDVDFAPLEFGLPPNQLEVTSTMQTLALGVARDLLIDADAVDSPWYDAGRTGVVLGTTGPVPLMHPLAARLSTPVLKEAARSVGLNDADADAIADRFAAAFAPWEANSFPGLLSNITAGRIANRLGLGGINCTVDAACAASLAALRTAIAELQDGRADMMITGGVDTENTIFIYMCFSKVGALSRSGRISPFSDDADGTLLGEGISMLALRRLEDARRDGNRIYAVIRGIGSSSDGRAKSIYAPRAGGQRVALDRAYADAEISPADVALLEAHATGTPVGDSTELSALKDLLTDATDEPRFAALGSVKSQIGHTKGAAGTASLMKLAFALHQKVLPGTINVSTPNSAIAGEQSPYYINSRTRPWIRDPQRPVRRAAASAFGFGGTNFHVVLEEADSSREEQQIFHRGARVHGWHAPNVADLIDAVRTRPSVDGGEIPDADARIGFVAIDDEEAEQLRQLAVNELIRDPGRSSWDHPEGVYFRSSALADRKIGALFAGQGSQYVDMGCDAAMSVPTVGAAFDAANESFAGAERRLSAVVFPPPAFDADSVEDAETRLRMTEFAQPAIGALSAGQFAALRERGFRADGYLGHSFGELTALWASGALESETFHALARARGLAMAPRAGQDSGTMTALNTTIDTARQIVDDIDDVWICNHNALDQVVIGGGRGAVEAAVAECERRSIPTRALPVADAFHTPYVGHAVDAFAEALDAVSIGASDAPVYPNTAGAHYGSDPAANREVLTRQLGLPVDFVAAVVAMHEAGCNVFVEFGPKQVLTSLVRRILGEDVIAFATDSGPIGNSDLSLARVAIRLWVLGVPMQSMNGHIAEDLEPHRPADGLTVTISAPEYVPEERKAAYSAALNDGYRLQTVASQDVSHAVAVQSDRVSEPEAEPPTVLTITEQPEAPMYAKEQTGDPVATALTQHIEVHQRFLEGQLGMATSVADALAGPHLDHETVRAIEAVKDHAVAIAGSHNRASEVLAHLADLEAGNSRPVEVRSAAPVESRAPEQVSLAPAEPVAAVAAPVPASVPAVAPAPAASTAPAASFASAALSAPVSDEPAVSSVGVGGREELRRVLREVVAEKTGYPVEMVDTSMDLEADLGVDSIKRVQVIGAVQERFPGLPELGPEQLGTLRTLDDVADLLGEGVAGGSDGPAVSSVGVGGREELRRVLREVVAEKTGYPVEMVDTSMDLEADLGVDSIKRVQVIGAVQERFPGLPELGPEQLGTLRTLDDVADLLGEGVAGGLDGPAVSSVGVGGREELRRVLREVVAEKTGYPVEMVDTSMDLEADLGVDSIKRVQVIGAVQERFPGLPELGPEQLGTLRTLDDVADLLAVEGGDSPKGEAAAGTSRHLVELTELPAADLAVNAYRDEPVALLIDLADNAAADLAALETELRSRGWDVRTASGVPEAGESADLCVIVADVDAETDWTASSDVLRDAILAAGAVTPGMSAENGRAGLVTVVRLDGRLGFHGEHSPVRALIGGIGGAVKTLAAERPDMFCRSIDVHPSANSEQYAEFVLAEVLDTALDVVEVGISADGTRVSAVPRDDLPAHSSTPIATADTQPATTLTADDLLIVSGGARGVTATCIKALARVSDCTFLLLGRTELVAEPTWAGGVAESGLRQAALRALAGTGASPREIERAVSEVRAGREIRETLAALSGRADYLAVDVTDADAVRTATAPWRDKVTGIVHGAGVLADSRIPDKTAESMSRVLSPKIAGLHALLSAVPTPDHLILFTSVAGLYGNSGQADYATANEALTKFALAWRREHPKSHVTAIDWGAWDGGMVTTDLRARFEAAGIDLLVPQVGADAFTEQFTPQRAGDTVVLVGTAKGLSSSERVPARTVSRRDIRSIDRDPVIASHLIGEHVVFPATFGMGAMVNVAERIAPGTRVSEIRDFHVLKGLVFDHPVEDVEIEITPGDAVDGALSAHAAVRDGKTTHFRAALTMTSALPPAPSMTVPEGNPSAVDIYREGIQFHGPALQGVRGVLDDQGETMVFECFLDAPPVAGGAYAGRLHDPLRADLILQCPPVLGHRLLGDACLPLGVGRVQYYHPLPVDEPFRVVVGNARVSGRFEVLVDATAVDGEGSVFQRFSDVLVVTTPGLTAKFNESVRSWLA